MRFLLFVSLSACIGIVDAAFERELRKGGGEERVPPKPPPTGLYRDTFQPLILRSRGLIEADAGCPIAVNRTSARTWVLSACSLQLACWAHDDLSWGCDRRPPEPL